MEAQTPYQQLQEDHCLHSLTDLRNFISIEVQRIRNIFRVWIYGYLSIYLFRVGSEHTLNNKRYPLELHVVMFNDKYADFIEAKDKTRGLAVFGFFYLVNL